MARRYIDKRGQVTDTADPNKILKGEVKEFNPPAPVTPAQARATKEAARAKRMGEIAAIEPRLSAIKAQQGLAFITPEQAQAAMQEQDKAISQIGVLPEEQKQVIAQQGQEEKKKITLSHILTGRNPNKPLPENTILEGSVPLGLPAGVVGTAAGVNLAGQAPNAEQIIGAAGSLAPRVSTSAASVAANTAGMSKLTKVVGAVLLGGSTISAPSVMKNRVNQAAVSFSTSRKNMRTIVNEVNSGLLSPEEAVILWNEELTNIRRAERTLKTISKYKLTEFLSGSGDELARIEAFNRVLPILNKQLATAITAPNPQINNPIIEDGGNGDSGLNL